MRWFASNTVVNLFWVSNCMTHRRYGLYCFQTHSTRRALDACWRRKGGQVQHFSTQIQAKLQNTITLMLFVYGWKRRFFFHWCGNILRPQLYLHRFSILVLLYFLLVQCQCMYEHRVFLYSKVSNKGVVTPKVFGLLQTNSGAVARLV